MRIESLDIRKLHNLYDYSVQFKPDLTFLYGSNGCGKTTILRVLIGLENADSGEIIKDGVDITNLPPSSRKMGIVFGVPAYSLSRRASASPSKGTISTLLPWSSFPRSSSFSTSMTAKATARTTPSSR